MIMNTIQQFIERNQHTYVKHSDAPKEVIEKYKKMYQGQSYFPEELIWIWENMGFGVYEDGFLQIVNPDEYEFVFEYIDKLLEPTVVWGVTALGNLLVWEGNDNWTIAPDEGNRYSFIDVNELKDSVDSSRVDVFLNILVNDEEDLTEDFAAKPYLQIKGKLPKLEYGQCYGYVPALALGGTKSNKNLKVVDTKSYIDIIGQSVGKIISYDD